MLDDLTIIRGAFPRTIRLVSSARLRSSILAELVDEDEMDELAEIEGGTSARLRAQAHGAGEVPVDELVYHVPHAGFINASFVYSKPRSPNRFNGPERGAWYAAIELQTAIHEVGYHLTNELANVGDFNAVVEYAEMFADFIGEFVDLRQSPDHQSLSPDKDVGYPTGNLLADRARADGLNGIVYPSVRNPGGTCFAILRPHAVQSVTQGDVWRMVWSGVPEFTYERA